MAHAASSRASAVRLASCPPLLRESQQRPHFPALRVVAHVIYNKNRRRRSLTHCSGTSSSVAYFIHLHNAVGLHSGGTQIVYACSLRPRLTTKNGGSADDFGSTSGVWYLMPLCHKLAIFSE